MGGLGQLTARKKAIFDKISIIQIRFLMVMGVEVTYLSCDGQKTIKKQFLGLFNGVMVRF